MLNREDYRGLALSVAVGVIGVTVALTAFRAGPKNPEDMALARSRYQRGSGDRLAALMTLIDCARRVPQACRCGDEAAELAVDINRFGEGLYALHRSPGCASARRTAEDAELTVARGALDEGLKRADEALSQAPDEPHACFAKAWALSAKGSSPQAIDLAEKAVQGGRGVPALLVLATLRAGANDRAGARKALDQAARLAPDDPRVAYDLGVMEAADRHYRESREAFLRALALDPKLADARYQLAVLAHSINADDEARHHLEQLAALVPNDPRIPSLRASLESK